MEPYHKDVFAGGPGFDGNAGGLFLTGSKDPIYSSAPINNCTHATERAESCGAGQNRARRAEGQAFHCASFGVVFLVSLYIPKF